MNVIISNRKKTMLENLPIEIMKSVNGVFTVDDIIQNFQNFYYQRMILDITSIANYQEITNLQKLSINLDVNKLILVLDEETSEPLYLSKLISMGIYNFTQNAEGVVYLFNHPNTYKDVAHYQQLNGIAGTEIIEKAEYVKQNNDGPQVIGIKNVTKQSGATTFIYMMKKQLEKNYKVVALEIDKQDFRYFNDKQMYSIEGKNYGIELAKYKDNDVILIDVNNDENVLNMLPNVYYLLEPSTMKLNKLLTIQPNALDKVKNRKVILNQSLLTDRDVVDFEYESNTRIYFNMPPLDERSKDNQKMVEFLKKIGFNI